jgi:hypothetical protein
MARHPEINMATTSRPMPSPAQHRCSGRDAVEIERKVTLAQDSWRAERVKTPLLKDALVARPDERPVAKPGDVQQHQHPHREFRPGRNKQPR